MRDYGTAGTFYSPHYHYLWANQVTCDNYAERRVYAAIRRSPFQEKAKMLISVFGKMAGMALLGVGLMVAGSAMAGDAIKGKKVFKKCNLCHYMDKQKNKTGPHLVAVLGRAAGSLGGYKYSKAMAASGLVWDEKTLANYLKAPNKYVKGTKMAFAGLKKDKDVADVIAYLNAAN